MTFLPLADAILPFSFAQRVALMMMMVAKKDTVDTELATDEYRQGNRLIGVYSLNLRNRPRRLRKVIIPSMKCWYDEMTV